MNKIYQNQKSNLTLLLVVLVVLLLPGAAHAGGFLEDTLWKVVNAVFGVWAWLGGMALDYAVTNYVVGFGTQFVTSGTGNSVNILWAVIRDMFNLTFIFGLVYIGLKMILDSSDSRARSMLVSLVLAALLVNFSLFITKFVIDFSNIAAAQFANAFLVSGEYNVSDSFMRILGFKDLWSLDGGLPNIGGTSAGLTYIFGTLVLYLVLAFVFMAGAIMLIIRYVVLIIYMILSPVMFLGWVFPGMAGVSRDYWKKFLGRAFFAPAYLLMLYIANQVLVNMQGSGGFTAQSWGQAIAPNSDSSGDSMAVLPFFFMTAGFLIASLVVAQKMGAEGANTAVSLGKRASGKAREYTGRLTVGAAAATGRNTLGRGANRLTVNPKLNKWASQSKFGAATLISARKVGDASFDARNVGGLGKATGLGQGVKGGFSSSLKAKQKADLEFAKSLPENKIELGLDGKIKDENIRNTVDKDVEAQRDDETTTYGYAVKTNTEFKNKKAEADAKLTLARTEESELNAKISKLEQDKQTAIINGGSTDVIEAQIETNKQSLATKQLETKSHDSEVKKLDTLTKKAREAEGRALKAAQESAESKIVYANQLEFIARREREVAGKSMIAAVAQAGAGAFIGGAVAGPVGAVVGAGAGFASGHARGSHNAAAVSELRKHYGTDGTVKKKSSQKEGELRILAEQLKEASGGDSEKSGGDDE